MGSSYNSCYGVFPSISNKSTFEQFKKFQEEISILHFSSITNYLLKIDDR